MALDLNELARKMLGGAKSVAAKQWPEMKDFAVAEMKKIAESIAMIEAMKLAGKITKEKACLHLDIQKNASRLVLLTIEGVGVVLAERAINAAFAAVKDMVNKAIGWSLL